MATIGDQHHYALEIKQTQNGLIRLFRSQEFMCLCSTLTLFVAKVKEPNGRSGYVLEEIKQQCKKDEQYCLQQARIH